MKNLLLAASAVALLSTATIQPAMAGNAFMSHANGKKAKVRCTGGGCVTKYYSKSGKMTRSVRSKGGRSNFLVIYNRLKGQGYR